MPTQTKEEVHIGFLLVIKCEGEEWKKNGCLQNPPKQPQSVFQSYFPKVLKNHFEAVKVKVTVFSSTDSLSALPGLK